MKRQGIVVFFCLILLFSPLLCTKTITAAPAPAPTIDLDEITADMEAYCLTVFSGMQVEKFPLKILSVVRGYRPGQNMILVVGTDERFQHAGPIHGCSGSPVFIDGRLAGALAAGWDGTLDALYLVRPIEDMLQVGTAGAPTEADTSAMGMRFDLSGLLDLDDIYQQAAEQMARRSNDSQRLIPLSSSLPAQACEAFRRPLRQMGFVPVSTPVALPTAPEATAFEQGGVLSVVLCGGDISLAATGTVTEIRGNQIYGFGHSFEGQGTTNLPIAAGIVHTVVPNRQSSFKFSSPGPILGTLDFDQSFAVRGTIGAKPETIPLTIRVNRYNAPADRTYDCYLASDRTYTPLILQLALSGAAMLQGTFPPEHTVRYDATVTVKGHEPLTFSNLSSGRGVSDLAQQLYAITALALNNPFEPLQVESIEAAMEITPDEKSADVRAMDVSRTRVKPGQTISITVTLMAFRSQEFTQTFEFTVPPTLPPGRYNLQVMGASLYQRIVTSLAPQRFRAVDTPTLMAALQRITAFRNNGLYAVMQVPATGIVMQHHELPRLPQTKMLLMQDDKRLRQVSAWQDWAESRLDIDYIVQGGAEIEITVEK